MSSLKSALGEFDGHVSASIVFRCWLIADGSQVLDSTDGLDMLKHEDTAV
jgi:hypothetical protein